LALNYDPILALALVVSLTLAAGAIIFSLWRLKAGGYYYHKVFRAGALASAACALILLGYITSLDKVGQMSNITLRLAASLAETGIGVGIWYTVLGLVLCALSWSGAWFIPLRPSPQDPSDADAYAELIQT
jgi:hypothetical protein